ncbi:hypothetical protein N5K21_27420 [Rhizobium pusense]|uniref:hypothetical protein n=1 Tax=Agrobacterium pusense TaxID=648995 RepID=UPI00244A6425|nr:hypothetical protein [Agrobacterium pusense]MDH2092453.1 hypothetical protein [Agrobacterium pusense]
MPDIELEIFTGYYNEGPTGPFSFSAAKFVDDLDQDQKARLAAIDAELAALLDTAPMDKAQMQALIHEVLDMVGL